MTRLKAILAGFSSLSGLALFVLACCNFVMAYKSVSVVRSVVVTNVVEVASSVAASSNAISSVFSSLSAPSVSADMPTEREPQEVARWPYRYFVVRRRIGCEFMNRYYYDGSPCSYGRIYQIYPDRILLADGDWISNSLLPSSAEGKVAKNDR